ncbi:MAG: hypothetical protein V1750_02420, partial [Acidobacteriota bacterium]
RAAPATKVILMTGHLSPGEKERVLAGGAFAYLLKPYPTADLVKVVEGAAAAGDGAARSDMG